MADRLPTVSIIVPTFNRKASLLRTLESLCAQTFSLEAVEVIIVDDGSTDDTHTIANYKFSFVVRYVRQDNQGVVAARNHGAMVAKSDILIFVDDDMTISPDAIESLANAITRTPQALIMGTLIPRSYHTPSVYTRIMLELLGQPQIEEELAERDFRACNSELLCCRRADYIALGMMQDLTMGNGWPNWDDLEFGYRAHLSGFRLLQSANAVGEHWDRVIGDRLISCWRWYQASKSAVWLFRRYQDLEGQIPMLKDKTPLRWGRDSPKLMLRKVARRVLSSTPLLTVGQRIVGLLEQRYPSPSVLTPLYHWLHGAYMFQGYREGLRLFRVVGVKK